MGVEIERKWLHDTVSGSLPENLRNNPIVDNYIMFEVTDNPDYYKRNYWKKTRLEK